MKPECSCSSNSNPLASENRTLVVACGFYSRKSDQVRVQRYRCQNCKKSFSDASYSACFGQKKRQFNGAVLKYLVSGVSQRRASLLLGINRKTVVRKFIFLGQAAKYFLPQINDLHPQVNIMEFDDLETFEHSKCKPLSVTLAVEHSSRRILGFRVSSMPAKGKLSAIARKRYGRRKDDRKKARKDLFQELRMIVAEDALIKSDQNPHYVSDVQTHFPKARHEAHKGRRGCVVGQGELKRGGFDPLFSLNHTCAMLRANINRLFRRTWCTTKLQDRLSYHIAIYALFHNLVLLHLKK